MIDHANNWWLTIANAIGEAYTALDGHDQVISYNKTAPSAPQIVEKNGLPQTDLQMPAIFHVKAYLDLISNVLTYTPGSDIGAKSKTGNRSSIPLYFNNRVTPIKAR